MRKRSGFETYAVKQLSDLAGVSVRTLHYYDEIGLLKPSAVAENGYRHYDEDAVLKLQQILFYREMGLGLLQIKDLLDAPDFDLVTALQSHRAELQIRIERLQTLMTTPEILRGLGQMYNQHPDFIAMFQQIHPDLPAFLEQAVTHYCDTLVPEA